MHATPVAVLALVLELLPNLVLRRTSLSPNYASSAIPSLRSSTRIYDYRGGRGIRSQSAERIRTQGRPRLAARITQQGTGVRTTGGGSDAPGK